MELLLIPTRRKEAMHKYVAMIFAVFLLSAGMAMAEDMSEEDIMDAVTIEFSGVAVEFYAGEIPGAPTIWTVNVTPDEESTICSDPIDVIVDQAIPGSWGTVNENVTIGDAVDVCGAYFEDEIGCIVTLQGSEDYYFELAEEEVEGETDGETEVVSEDGAEGAIEKASPTPAVVVVKR
jgi:hypothetical protein